MKTITTKENVRHPYIRTDLLKVWNKASKNAPVSVCTHSNVKRWDCGCSWGCAHCDYGHECSDCGSLLKQNQLNTPVVTLLK